MGYRSTVIFEVRTVRPDQVDRHGEQCGHCDHEPNPIDTNLYVPLDTEDGENIQLLDCCFHCVLDILHNDTHRLDLDRPVIAETSR
jgi:hypothetical protein